MKKIIAVLFLVILLASQVQLTWSNHYCGTRIVKSSFMFGHGHLTCGMTEMEACDTDIPKGKASFIPVGCCSNDYYSSDSDDFLNKATSPDIKLPVVELIFNTTFIAFHGSAFHFENPFTDISPPPLNLDIHVMNEVFII